MSTSPSLGLERVYRLVSPHGRIIETTAEVFEAFEEALGGTKPAKIEIDIRNRGVAGVRVNKVLK